MLDILRPWKKCYRLNIPRWVQCLNVMTSALFTLLKVGFVGYPWPSLLSFSLLIIHLFLA
jgi:hypothetical protein